LVKFHAAKRKMHAFTAQSHRPSNIRHAAAKIFTCRLSAASEALAIGALLRAFAR
jgi:hypothetical protein